VSAPIASLTSGLRQLAEVRLLLLLLLLAAALWGFVQVVDEVREGEAEAFDRALLLALRARDDPTLPWGPPWFQEAMRDVTALGGMTIVVLVTLAASAFLACSGHRGGAVLVMVAVAGAVLWSLALKAGFDRPRPELVPHGSIAITTSFPSGHSATATATWLTLGALLARFQTRRRLKALAMGLGILIALGVGVSRVYLGVHWPTDVLAGWTLGGAWALLCWLAATWLQRRGIVEPEEGTG
jgi:undecaprenyl-diphosphatase